MNGSWLIANPLPTRSTSCNKDLNGGYGTCDKIGDSILAKLIARFKGRAIKLPVLSLSYISSILKLKGKNLFYSEDYNSCLNIISKNSIEACIIYGSIVASDVELELIKSIRKINQETLIIVVGTFPTKFPDIFNIADCVIAGEPEDAFLNWDGSLDYFMRNGSIINSKNLQSLDFLPEPDFGDMNPEYFSYSPMLKRPTGFIESSRGCPYSCGYYCTYGENQGKSIRSYSPSKLVDIMIKLKEKYKFRSYQFRDPVFGLKKGYIEEFSLEILKNNLEIEWGMETRSDILDLEKILLMKKAGLKSINIGIETPNTEIAIGNKRKTDQEEHLINLISDAKREGVRINGFYILGFENDDFQSCLKTIKYSLNIDTYMARYSVCTPYPGTMYHYELEAKNKIIEVDYSKYNQQELVFKHDKLDPKDINKLTEMAYRKYYFRPKTLIKLALNLIS